MNREIRELLDDGCVFVTATQGLARHLQEIYAAQQIEDNISCWKTPNILSWSAWCGTLWDECMVRGNDSRLLISQHQSLCLWQEVIQSSRYAKNILQIAATARQVQAAYALCRNWQIEEFPDDIFLNEDAFAFKVWRESYELRLKANSFIDEAGLIDELILHADVINYIDTSSVFYGFDELTPAQKKLIQVIQCRYKDTRVLAVPDINESHTVVDFQDEKSEIESIADWIVDCHQAEARAQIGIVVPNLKARRELLINTLEKKLCVNNLLGLQSTHALPFTISIGSSLAEYPLLFVALELLQLNAHRIRIESFSLLLRSPFIGDYSKDASQRHLLDARIRKSGQAHFSYKNIQAIHEQIPGEQQCSEFMKLLDEFFTTIEKLPSKEKFSFWSRQFHEVLKLVTWPGTRKIDSDEYQTLEQWQKALQSLSALDSILRPANLQQAVKQLRRICKDVSFQPKSPTARIHLLSVAGASGMQFDYLWFMGLHDQQWPQKNEANAFIPVKLQQQAGVANASPETNLQLARVITGNIVQSAKQVVLSHARTENDRELRASPLLHSYRSDVECSSENFIHYDEKIFSAREQQHFYDETGPAIKKGESVNGGSALFKDYAACPFKAFARHRLHADSLGSSDIGLSAIDRGLLVHRVLQLFWQKVKHSDQLRRASDTVLNDRIEEVVNKAILEERVRLSETFGERFTEIEKQRLCRLMHDWLQLEKDRPAFSVIATEKGHHVLFNDFTLHMRIDRIDELADGRLLIIDYKTGQINTNVWSGERPDDPQLPLYAITSDKAPAALLFARIKTGESGFIGLAEEENLLPNVKAPADADWNETIEQWKTTLSNLADEYRTGRATVEPKIKACGLCDLHVLCRIHEKIKFSEDSFE